MSRKHSSSLNVGGLSRSLPFTPNKRPLGRPQRSPSRSPARTKNARGVKRTLVQTLITDLLDTDQPSTLEDLEQKYIASIDGTGFFASLIHQGSHFILMPAHDGHGNLADNRSFVTVSREEDSDVYMCSCDTSRGHAIQALGERCNVHVNTLSVTECCHISFSRTLNPDDTVANPSPIVTISDNPLLVVVVVVNPGVVKRTASKCLCLTCHSETCDHVRALRQSPNWLEEDAEDECDERKLAKWINLVQDLCEHGEQLKSAKKEVSIANGDGHVMKESIVFLTSSCCSLFYRTRRALLLSTRFGADISLMLRYKSLFTTCCASASGFTNSLRVYAQETGDTVHDLISTSSIQRLWSVYLEELTIEKERFLCPECGAFPKVIVVDGIQLGLRSNVGLLKEVPKNNERVACRPLLYFGTRNDRKRTLKYLSGGGEKPECAWPHPLKILLETVYSSDLASAQPYIPFINFVLADSPLCSILQGAERGREMLKQVITDTIDWTNGEQEMAFLKEWPVLYKALKPFISSTGNIPSTVRDVISFMLTEIEEMGAEGDREDTVYGAAEESDVDFYPLWPLLKGRTSYAKDGRNEQELQCSRKEIGQSAYRLSPGMMLFTCHHGQPYGFTILKMGESPRHVFDVLLCRFPSAQLPSTVIYDNGCRLSAYCMAREPTHFANVRFMVDRFHHYNHRGCSHSLRLRSYEANPAFRLLNSQSAEQLNSQIRHIGNILPFMSFAKYFKSMSLFLSYRRK